MIDTSHLLERTKFEARTPCLVQTFGGGETLSQYPQDHRVRSRPSDIPHLCIAVESMRFYASVRIRVFGDRHMVPVPGPGTGSANEPVPGPAGPARAESIERRRLMRTFMLCLSLCFAFALLSWLSRWLMHVKQTTS